MTIAVTGHPAWRRSTSAAARIPGLCDAGRHDPRYRPQGRAAVRRALRGPRRQDHAPERVLGQRHDDAPARAPATAGERPRARHDGSDGFGCPGEATVQAELIARYRVLHCQPAFEVTAIARRTSARGDRSRRMSRTTSGGAQRNVQLSRARQECQARCVKSCAPAGLGTSSIPRAAQFERGMTASARRLGSSPSCVTLPAALLARPPRRTRHSPACASCSRGSARSELAAKQSQGGPNSSPGHRAGGLSRSIAGEVIRRPGRGRKGRPVHNLIDIVAGALLVALPWIFGFAGGVRRRCGDG
jgi:hypothetical protein